LQTREPSKTMLTPARDAVDKTPRALALARRVFHEPLHRFTRAKVRM
jgi:hypothetical protein